MKSINYNQLRQVTFEKVQTLDLTHFQQNKNFYYELNDFEIPFDLYQNSTELENHFKKIKNKSVQNKNLKALIAINFAEFLFALLRKAKEDEISKSQIRTDLSNLLNKLDLDKIIKMISKIEEAENSENLLKPLKLLQSRKPKSAWISEKDLIRNTILKDFTSGIYGCLLPESSQDNGRYFSCVFFNTRRKWSQFTLVKIARWITIEDYENILSEAEEFKKTNQHQTELIIVSLGFSEEVFAKFSKGEKGSLEELSLKEVEFRANLDDAYENFSNRLIDHNEI